MAAVIMNGYCFFRLLHCPEAFPAVGRNPGVFEQRSDFVEAFGLIDDVSLIALMAASISRMPPD
jgi:hypothetical protein